MHSLVPKGQLVKIAIVGAGIGGLATASMLANSGHTVSVFETFEQATPVGAGLLLQPPGQAVLKSLGVLREAQSSGCSISKLHSLTTAGRSLLDISYDDLPGRARNGLGIQREKLHAVLMETALKTSTSFHFSTPIKASTMENDSIFLVSNSERYGPFDFVIVSSGSRSEWLNDKSFGRQARPYHWGCMWATVPLPDTLNSHTLHQRCYGTRKMIGLLPTRLSANGPSAALYWSVKETDAAKWLSDGYPAFLDELGALWPEAAAAASNISAHNFTFARYQDIWTKRPYQSRMLLIGDAAHGTSPQLGQGASMALLDAAAVDICLQNVSGNKNDIENAMKHYRDERLAHQRYVRYASRALTPVFQHHSRYKGVLRDWFCGSASRLPVANAIAVKTLACEMFNKG